MSDFEQMAPAGAIEDRLEALEDIATVLRGKFPELIAGPAAALKQPCGEAFTTTGDTGSAGATHKGLEIAEDKARALARLICATNPNCRTPELKRVVDVTPDTRNVKVKFEWKCVKS